MSEERLALDAALLARGEDIVLRRQVAAGENFTNIDVTCRARVDAVRVDQIAGSITQHDLTVIMSPTEILESQWPGGVPVDPGNVYPDPQMPRATDYVVVRGKVRQIKMVDALFTPDWCRINLVVAG